MFKVFAVWLTGIGMGMGMGIGIGMGSLSAAAETSMDLEELQVQYPARYFQTVHLPSGRVHYQLAGNGPVIILIHGVSGPMAVWDRTYEALVGAGYRVVRFDLLGRGFSERLPDSAYSLGLYVRQLEELIAALDLGTGVRLIGSSFGAVIATEYALHHPDSVKGLVLIGPAGFPLSTPPVAKLGRIPLVGEFMTALFSYRVILEQNHRYFVSGQLPEELQPYIEDHLAIEGTTDAILRTMQNPSLQSFVDSYRTLAGFDIPVGVVWGVQDKTFPVLYASTLLEALPHAEFVAIERAGHLPQYESAIEVNRALVNILKSFPAAESLRAAIRPARLAFPKHTEREIEREALDRGAKEDRLFGFEQPFFKELSLEEREIQLTPQVSRIYRFPTLYDQVTASGALFLCDYEAAAQRLPPGLRPVHFGAGRAAVMISSFRYGRVQGMKPYSEVAVAILVRRAEAVEPGWLSLLKSKGQEISSYVISMPVTSLENQLRGEKIWGFPKMVREIDLRQFDKEFVTTVFDRNGKPYMELRVPMRGSAEELDQETTLHSQLDHQPLVSRSHARGHVDSTFNADVLLAGRARARAHGRRSVSLSLWDSGEAHMLRELQIDPRPLKVVFGTGVQSFLTLPEED